MCGPRFCAMQSRFRLEGAEESMEKPKEEPVPANAATGESAPPGRAQGPTVRPAPRH
jgi:hypothetical protein